MILYGAQAKALDCSIDLSIVMSIALYDGTNVGVHPRYPENQVVVPSTTCAQGMVEDSTSEPQFTMLEKTWSDYSVMVSPRIKEPFAEIFGESPNGKPININIGTVMFVEMMQAPPTVAESIQLVSFLLEYSSRKEGGTTNTGQYEIFQWSPDIVIHQPVVVFGSGQILILEKAIWRDSCKTLTDYKTRIDDQMGKYIEFTVYSDGFPDECSA